MHRLNLKTIQVHITISFSLLQSGCFVPDEACFLVGKNIDVIDGK